MQYMRLWTVQSYSAAFRARDLCDVNHWIQLQMMQDLDAYSNNVC